MVSIAQHFGQAAENFSIKRRRTVKRAVASAEACMLSELNCPVPANENSHGTGRFRISTQPELMERCLGYSIAERIGRISNIQVSTRYVVATTYTQAVSANPLMIR